MPLGPIIVRSCQYLRTKTTVERVQEGFLPSEIISINFKSQLINPFPAFTLEIPLRSLLTLERSPELKYNLDSVFIIHFSTIKGSGRELLPSQRIITNFRRKIKQISLSPASGPNGFIPSSGTSLSGLWKFHNPIP